MAVPRLSITVHHSSRTDEDFRRTKVVRVSATANKLCAVDARKAIGRSIYRDRSNHTTYREHETMAHGKVALTGAAGNIGRLLRTELPRHGISLRSAAHSSLEPLFDGEDLVHGDLREAAVVDRLLNGIDTVVHLAGTSVERPLAEIIDNNLIALHQLYEGARRHKVRRVVFASSNHAFGMYSVNELLRPEAAYRPDGLYGLSKAWGELMGQMYWDKHGIEGVALRIGSCEEVPTNPRHLSTWLSHEDIVRLVVSSLRARDVGYTAVWGISDNARAYWAPTASAALGYHPESNAEVHAARVSAQPNPLDPIARQFQGGAFVTLDYTVPEDRPRDQI